MPLDVGIVGLAGSGKTALFNALTRAGASEHERKEHVGMAPIADDRLDGVAAVEASAKITPATIRVVDVPGTGPALLGNLRKSDALLIVVRDDGDLENLQLELLVADRDHVEKRLERGRSALEEVEIRLKDALDLVAFFTASDTEARAWTLRRGQSALEAAESIHTDIARGFIRCEVIRWNDLVECCSRAEAARRGL